MTFRLRPERALCGRRSCGYVLHLFTRDEEKSGDNLAPGPGWVGGRMDLAGHAATMSMTGGAVGAPSPRLDERTRRRVAYVALRDVTKRQDWAACESVQGGLASGAYVPGRSRHAKTRCMRWCSGSPSGTAPR